MFLTGAFFVGGGGREGGGTLKKENGQECPFSG